jgi:hypothetical protein
VLTVGPVLVRPARPKLRAHRDPTNQYPARPGPTPPILQRKVIRNGSFESRDELIAKLLGFITDYDQTARPFKWTYAADPPKAA